MTIKEIRALTGLTQKQFAEKYHITFSSIRNWESGHRTCPDYVSELLEFKVREDLRMEAKHKTFVNPCKMYARINRKEVVQINGFKLELDTIILYFGSSACGYREERFMLNEVEIFEQ